MIGNLKAETATLRLIVAEVSNNKFVTKFIHIYLAEQL